MRTRYRLLPPSPLPSSRLLPVLACLALAVSACGGGDDDLSARVAELEAAVEQGSEAEDTLRTRVEELEALLADDGEAGDEDPLAGLRSSVAALREDVDRLDASISDGESSRSQAVDALRADVVALDQKLGELRGGITALTERVDLLTDDLNSLEAQFKSHDHGG